MSVTFIISLAVILIFAIVAFAISLKTGVKPLSIHQKLGITISIFALISFLFLPIASFGGLISVSLRGILTQFVEGSWDLQYDYCQRFVPLGVNIAIFAPIITIIMFLHNRGLRWCGILLLLAPLFEILLFTTDSFFHGLDLSVGIYIYLLCGIILLILPMFMKNEQTIATTKSRTLIFAITLTFYSCVATLPALYVMYEVCINDMVDDEDEIEDDTEVANTETIDDDLVVDSDISDETLNNNITSFITGDLEDIQVFDASDENVVYTFGNYVIQIVADHGGMVVRARKKSGDDWIYMPTENLFAMGDDMDFGGEIFIGQCDLDKDSRKELFIGARNYNGEPEGISLNIYRLNANGNFDFDHSSYLYEQGYNEISIEKDQESLFFTYGEEYATQYTLQTDGKWSENNN